MIPLTELNNEIKEQDRLSVEEYKILSQAITFPMLKTRQLFKNTLIQTVPENITRTTNCRRINGKIGSVAKDTGQAGYGVFFRNENENNIANQQTTSRTPSNRKWKQ